MLMSAILNTPPTRKIDFSVPTPTPTRTTTYNHERIAPAQTPSESEDSSCPSTQSAKDVQPLGLRLEQLVQAHRPVAVAITKIQNLKHIRYALHWETGDVVRETVAELVSDHSGNASWTMAYDSADFLTVMPNCTLQEASTRASAWQQAIQAYPWQQVHPALHVKVAVGIAAQEPLADYEKLLADADVALRCSLS